MIYLLVALSYTVWIMYSFLEGVREAFSKQTKTFKRLKCTNWTTITLIQRSIFFLLISYIIYLNVGCIQSLIFSVGMIPVFYYIQNGTYFLIKNKMNPNIFTEGYLSDSIGSDSPIMYCKYNIRRLVAVLGVFIQPLIFFT